MSIAMAIVLAVVTAVRPYFVKITVDKYISSGLPKWAQMIILLTILQIGILLVETALRFYFTYITSWLGQTVVRDMRVKVYEKVLNLNLRQFDQTPIGTLTTRTINDIEAINDIFSDGLIPIIADMLSIISILCFMFYVDWKLTLVCLAPFPVLIIATYYFKESVNKSFIKVRNAVAALNAFVQEHLTGMHVVQAFAAEDREFEKFRAINTGHRNSNIKAIFAYSIFFPVVEIVLAMSIGLMVWYSTGQKQEAGVIASFILYLNLLFRPLRVIADKFNVLQMGVIASERVFRVMDNADYIHSKGSFAPGKIRGAIRFDQVSFGYDPEHEVLKNVSFNVKPGETIAIVGHTGSGKTTIISLLNRLYEIQ
jgi:ATP-binding cassette subfamily B protein